MLFEKDEELELQPKRTRTLLISIGIHVVLLLILFLNPDLLTSTPKRIVRIMGQDYDLSKQQLTELVMPPDSLRSRPAPAPDKPLVQPPQQPNQATPPPQQPPPPPPPQQQPPPPPPPVIGPDDILKEGARPDAQPKASRGDTSEQARAGGQQQEQQPKPEPPKPQGGENKPPLLAQNTNPNALRVPSLAESAGKIVQQSIDENRRRYSQQPGGRTGLPGAQEDNPNFSTEEPTILSDTKGYDFGPYMNQVVNRVRYNWYSLIPEIARLGKKGRVVIIFTITASGTIDNPHIVANSGADPLDKAAYGSIIASNPFAKLPAGFDGDRLVLQFTFLYNIR